MLEIPDDEEASEGDNGEAEANQTSAHISHRGHIDRDPNAAREGRQDLRVNLYREDLPKQIGPGGSHNQQPPGKVFVVR